MTMTGSSGVQQAVSQLGRQLGLQWAIFDGDGKCLERHPEAAGEQCLGPQHCSLQRVESQCPGAVVVRPAVELSSEWRLVACRGCPQAEPPQQAAETLAGALYASRRAEEEMSSTIRELTVTYQELAIAYGTLEAVSIASPRETMAGEVLERVTAAVNASGGCFLSREAGGRIEALAVYDLAPPELSLAQRLLRDLPAIPAAPAGSPQTRWNDPPLSVRADEYHLLACPVISGEQCLGLLAVSRPLDTPFSSREAKLLRATSRQAALAIRNRTLVDELRDLFLSTVEALVAAIEAKDPYTCGHSRRVAESARATAELLGWEQGQRDDLYTAAVVHDIGKIGVDTAILRKQGRLTAEEWLSVREHPARGAAIIGCVPQLRHLTAAVRHHHERADGRGYPDGLDRQEMPLGARIISVCDAFDAMTSQRPYRLAVDEKAACTELARCAGSQFDEEVVEAFATTRIA